MCSLGKLIEEQQDCREAVGQHSRVRGQNVNNNSLVRIAKPLYSAGRAKLREQFEYDWLLGVIFPLSFAFFSK